MCVPAEVLADYVCWEYLSETGWKRLLKDERTGTMFNGSVEGPMTMEFICPEDMAEYDPERREPEESVFVFCRQKIFTGCRQSINAR